MCCNVSFIVLLVLTMHSLYIYVHLFVHFGLFVHVQICKQISFRDLNEINLHILAYSFVLVLRCMLTSRTN